MIALIDKNGNLYWVLESERHYSNDREATQQEIDNWNKQRDLDYLRALRQSECFTVINRGELWYKNLTEQQLTELDNWYKEWLNITDAYEANPNIDEIIPMKPNWIE